MIFITVKLENNHTVLKQVNIMVKYFDGVLMFFWGIWDSGRDPQEIAGINTAPRSAVRLDGVVLIKKSTAMAAMMEQIQ